MTKDELDRFHTLANRIGYKSQETNLSYQHEIDEIFKLLSEHVTTQVANELFYK